MNRSQNETYAVPSVSLAVDRYIVNAATILIAFLLVFFMLFPLYKILVMSFFKEGIFSLENFTLGNYIKYFGTPRIAKSLYNSLYVSIITMAITTTLAFFFAYALTRTTILGKGFFYTVAFMPLIAPSIIQALALILLFGRNGLITAHLFKTGWSIYGAWGIIISEVLYSSSPRPGVSFTLPCLAVDTRLDEAAESLGANALQVFWKVTIPSAKYGILSAAALTFNLTITDFGNPVVIGGDFNVLATEIYAQVTNLYRFDLGATVSVILLVPSVAAFMFNYYVTRKEFCPHKRCGKPVYQTFQTPKKMGIYRFTASLFQPLSSWSLQQW